MPSLPDSRTLGTYLALIVVVGALGVRQLIHRGDGGVGGGSSAVAAQAPRTTADTAGDAHERGAAAGGAPSGVSLARASSALVVHVAGAVRRPGVYRLKAGARVDDAVRRAGGARRGADLTAVNLAAKLEDGRQIIVPVAVAASPGGSGAVAASPGGSAAIGGTRPGAPSPGSAVGAVAAPAAKVNLNTATAEQLDGLDGIGPGLAAKILGYRQEHGGFRTVRELGEVPGIGDKRLAALQGAVTT